MNIRPLYDRLMVKRIEETERMQAGLHIPDSAKESHRKAKWSLRARASNSRTASWLPSMSKSAIASCSASIPAVKSSWTAKSISFMREDDVLGILAGATKLAKAS